jgi:spore coat protein U-like protein
MGQGANYNAGTNNMVSNGNLLPYGLYVDSGYTTPWLTASDSATCTTSSDCYTGGSSGTTGPAGTGSAQTITIYAKIPKQGSAPVPGTYTDSVTLSIYF